MKEDQYIIVSKTAIQTRIDEIIVEQKNIIKKLKKLYEDLKGSNKYFGYKDNLSRYFTALTNEKRLLEKILSQSTPLIPVVEKAIKYGLLEGSGGELCEIKDEVVEHQQYYISDLKLNI